MSSANLGRFRRKLPSRVFHPTAPTAGQTQGTNPYLADASEHPQWSLGPFPASNVAQDAGALVAMGPVDGRAGLGRGIFVNANGLNTQYPHAAQLEHEIMILSQGVFLYLLSPEGAASNKFLTDGTVTKVIPVKEGLRNFVSEKISFKGKPVTPIGEHGVGGTIQVDEERKVIHLQRVAANLDMGTIALRLKQGQLLRDILLGLLKEAFEGKIEEAILAALMSSPSQVLRGARFRDQVTISWLDAHQPLLQVFGMVNRDSRHFLVKAIQEGRIFDQSAHAKPKTLILASDSFVLATNQRSAHNTHAVLGNQAIRNLNSDTLPVGTHSSGTVVDDIMFRSVHKTVSTDDTRHIFTQRLATLQHFVTPQMDPLDGPVAVITKGFVSLNADRDLTMESLVSALRGIFFHDGTDGGTDGDFKGPADLNNLHVMAHFTDVEGSTEQLVKSLRDSPFYKPDGTPASMFYELNRIDADDLFQLIEGAKRRIPDWERVERDLGELQQLVAEILAPKAKYVGTDGRWHSLAAILSHTTPQEATTHLKLPPTEYTSPSWSGINALAGSDPRVAKLLTSYRKVCEWIKYHFHEPWALLDSDDYPEEKGPDGALWYLVFLQSISLVKPKTGFVIGRDALEFLSQRRSHLESTITIGSKDFYQQEEKKYQELRKKRIPTQEEVKHSATRYAAYSGGYDNITHTPGPTEPEFPFFKEVLASKSKWDQRLNKIRQQIITEILAAQPDPKGKAAAPISSPPAFSSSTSSDPSSDSSSPSSTSAQPTARPAKSPGSHQESKEHPLSNEKIHEMGERWVAKYGRGAVEHQMSGIKDLFGDIVDEAQFGRKVLALAQKPRSIAQILDEKEEWKSLPKSLADCSLGLFPGDIFIVALSLAEARSPMSKQKEQTAGQIDAIERELAGLQEESTSSEGKQEAIEELQKRLDSTRTPHDDLYDHWFLAPINWSTGKMLEGLTSTSDSSASNPVTSAFRNVLQALEIGDDLKSHVVKWREILGEISNFPEHVRHKIMGNIPNLQAGSMLLEIGTRLLDDSLVALGKAKELSAFVASFRTHWIADWTLGYAGLRALAESFAGLQSPLEEFKTEAQAKEEAALAAEHEYRVMALAEAEFLPKIDHKAYYAEHATRFPADADARGEALRSWIGSHQSPLSRLVGIQYLRSRVDFQTFLRMARAGVPLPIRFCVRWFEEYEGQCAIMLVPNGETVMAAASPITLVEGSNASVRTNKKVLDMRIAAAVHTFENCRRLELALLERFRGGDRYARIPAGGLDLHDIQELGYFVTVMGYNERLETGDPNQIPIPLLHEHIPLTNFLGDKRLDKGTPLACWPWVRQHYFKSRISLAVIDNGSYLGPLEVQLPMLTSLPSTVIFRYANGERRTDKAGFSYFPPEACLGNCLDKKLGIGRNEFIVA